MSLFILLPIPVGIISFPLLGGFMIQKISGKKLSHTEKFASLEDKTEAAEGRLSMMVNGSQG